MKTLLKTLLLSVVLVNAAQAMRCGTQLINDGDTRHRVLALCGTPDGDSYSTMLYLNPRGDGMNYELHIGSSGHVDRISYSR